ncbi:MAG TPA: tetratricopeptide repeat protein [Stellaceae bacterium]|nr:tetratricopeptide repeat protein [Stellaceae bacterium]
MGHHQTAKLADPIRAGSASLVAGDFVNAEVMFRRAVRQTPGNADAYAGLGAVLAMRSKSTGAEVAFRRAIKLQPDNAGTLINLSILLIQTGRAAQAEEHLLTALTLQPSSAKAYLNLGHVMIATGRKDEAIQAFRDAIRLQPNLTPASILLALLCHRAGRSDEAESLLRNALSCDPNNIDVRENLGIIVWDAGRRAEAEAIFLELIARWPDHARSYSNLGSILKNIGRLAEAAQTLRRAIDLDPNLTTAHSNLGSVLYGQQDVLAARVHLKRALEIDPNFADAKWNLALVELILGNYEAGFSWAEWRWTGCASLKNIHRDFSGAQWKGEPLPVGTTLLIHAEQGLGDTLQFIRYAPMAAARGLKVIVEVQRPLARLIRGVPGIDQIIQQGEPLPPYDMHVPMVSLPYVFGTTLDTIPVTIPYLAPEPISVEQWRHRLGDDPRPRIGLVWAGAPQPIEAHTDAWDLRRSVRLEDFAPLAAVEGARFISLQKGGSAAQLNAPPAGLVIEDWMNEVTDFADTAALLANLDLVISVDTSVVHLAGALGKPVWVLSRFDGCWRWLLEREDSPWYPSARLFRQKSFADWGDTFEHVAKALAQFVACSGHPEPIP